jgi:hypothetical protein
MKKARCWIVFMFVALGLINLHSLVFAQAEIARKTLRGLKGVKVTITIESKLLEEMEIENQLQTDAELKLRMAGIKVVSSGELSKLPGRPELVLTVHAYKVNKTAYISTIGIDLLQDVTLIRNNTWARGITWSTGWVGWTPPTYSLSDQFRDGVKGCIDMFINAYLSVNPK